MTDRKSFASGNGLPWQLLFLMPFIIGINGFAATQTDRHVDVHPVTPRSGVTGGVVIAFGHVIPGPYRFKYDDSKLFVNGVQLIPSPVAEKENEAVRALVTNDKRSLFAELGRIEERARKMFEERRSHEEILQFVKSHAAIIADAKWEGERAMNMRLVGASDFTQALWFTGLTQETKKQALGTADPQEFRKRMIDQYERDLKKGVCLFFSSDNGVMRMDDPRSKVIEVMKKKGLSGEERERAISDIFPMNQIAAFDVLANFSEAAWVLKQK